MKEIEVLLLVVHYHYSIHWVDQRTHHEFVPSQTLDLARLLCILPIYATLCTTMRRLLPMIGRLKPP